METVGKLMTVISGLLRLIVSGCLPVWMAQSNVGSHAKLVLCGGGPVAGMGRLWCGCLSRVELLHSGIALFSIELPYPVRYRTI